MKTQSILKTALLSAGFSAFTLIGSAQAQVIINVQFAPTAILNGTPWTSTVAPLAYAGTTWNTDSNSPAPTNPDIQSNLLTSTGAGSSIGYTLASPNAGTGEAVIFGDDPDSLQTLTLLQNGLGAGNSLTFTLSGLNNADTYNLYFATDGHVDPTNFTLGADVVGPFSPTNLSSWVGGSTGNYAEFAGIAPTSGSIEVTISGPDSYIGSLSGFQLQDVPAPVVPEPSTYALMGLGALALLVISRRRKA